MIKSNPKIAWRNLYTHKLYSLIHIVYRIDILWWMFAAAGIGGSGDSTVDG